MRRNLLIKIAVTLLLALLLGLPLGAVRDVIRERQQRNDAVLLDIKSSDVAEQRITGPILVVPYRQTRITEVTDPTTGSKSTVSNTTNGFVHFLPDTLDVDVHVATDTRSRGIYSALVFRGQHTLGGVFTLPKGLGVERDPSIRYEWGRASVVLGIGDPRGIRSTPTLRWDGASPTWVGGAERLPRTRGIHADVGPIAEEASQHKFKIELDLQGTEAIDYVPVGKETVVTMKAAWPHPSFGGRFLPDRRAIGADGFEATWRTSHLASDVASELAACVHGGCDTAPTTLGVAFIDPVDVYLKSERAAKYGFLFIAITFVVFFLVEVLDRLAIHPVQYGLVGVALAIFFLLLLALAEHVAFPIAYAVAGAGCVGLLGFYLRFVLKSAARGLGFAGLLASLYGALYVLLQSEDMALLMGAGLLFVLLAAVMVITRRVDWYRISEPARTEHASS